MSNESEEPSVDPGGEPVGREAGDGVTESDQLPEEQPGGAHPGTPSSPERRRRDVPHPPPSRRATGNDRG